MLHDFNFPVQVAVVMSIASNSYTHCNLSNGWVSQSY